MILESVASMHEVFVEKLGREAERGQFLHILCAGALPSARGSNITDKLLLMAIRNHALKGYYIGLTTEATGFASQRLVTKQQMVGEEWGFTVSKPYQEFRHEDGTPIFPHVQTKHLLLWFQWLPPPGLDREFQLGALYLSAYLTEVSAKASIETQLKLLALFNRGSKDMGPGGEPSRLDVVRRAKWSAAVEVVHVSQEEARKAFVELLSDAIPCWMDQIDRLRDVGPVVRYKAADEDMRRSIWVPDRFAQNCMRCQSTFGIFVRQHHCRRCGLCVCGPCSRGKAVVPLWGKIAQRCCDHCMSFMPKGLTERGLNAPGS